MAGGYVMLKDDVVKRATEAYDSNDVEFPYKGAFDYFKSLIDSKKPIMFPAIEVEGEKNTPKYIKATEIDGGVYIYCDFYRLSVDSSFPNKISVN